MALKSDIKKILTEEQMYQKDLAEINRLPSTPDYFRVFARLEDMIRADDLKRRYTKNALSDKTIHQLPSLQK